MHVNCPGAIEMPNTVPLTLLPIVELTSSCSAGSIGKVKTSLNLQLTKLRRMSDSDGC